jgi:hypothetical protein
MAPDISIFKKRCLPGCLRRIRQHRGLDDAVIVDDGKWLYLFLSQFEDTGFIEEFRFIPFDEIVKLLDVGISECLRQRPHSDPFSALVVHDLGI